MATVRYWFGSAARVTLFLLIVSTAIAVVVVLCQAEKKGPIEKAGESVDKAIKEAGEAVHHAGDQIKHVGK